MLIESAYFRGVRSASVDHITTRNRQLVRLMATALRKDLADKHGVLLFCLSGSHCAMLALQHDVLT